ncbi:MAG: metal-sulfur cluster assembly factor [Candidatus ainarchaeum sp.]|nr:metal-sulfur cluster assembly factor [Candidatus ainarchaeum sp.]
MLTKQSILEKLKEIIDPELGINLVDLGLFYEVKVEKPGKKREGAHVEVKMTLTSIGCPLAGFFAMQVEEKVKSIPGVKDVHVHVVWEPPWTPEKMTKSAREQLGFS